MYKNSIISQLKIYLPQVQPITPRSASVIVFLVINEEDDHLFVLLTKRAQKGPYAGDYCFPGGMAEESDLTITALREVAEELGLSNLDYSIISQLDDFEDRFGNIVRPYVATIEQNKIDKIRANPDEVTSIYLLPLDEIKKIQIDLLKTMRQPSYHYSHDEVYIWGLTASILVHLGNIVFGMDKKVGKMINIKGQ